MPDFVLKRNDTSPAIERTLKDGDGNAVDITGFNEVKFLMRERGSTTVKVSDNTAGNVSVIGDASNGDVKYEWVAADTDTAGIYEAEFEVEYSDGTFETFPNGKYIIIEINEDVDDS